MPLDDIDLVSRAGERGIETIRAQIQAVENILKLKYTEPPDVRSKILSKLMFASCV